MKPLPKKLKPVYSVAPATEGFSVQADNKPLRTPAGADFIVPTQNLAEAIKSEWQAQGDKVNPATMPLTQLTATSIDITTKERGKIIDQMIAYISSELLCHRVEEPPELVKRQEDTWQPILDWCEQHVDDVILQTGTGIMPIKQTNETVQAMRAFIERYDAFALTGLHHAVDVSGSLVLGLALTEKHMSANDVFDAAELDSSFQMEKWGEDPVTAHRSENTRKELSLCEKWFALLKK